MFQRTSSEVTQVRNNILRNDPSRFGYLYFENKTKQKTLSFVSTLNKPRSGLLYYEASIQNFSFYRIEVHKKMFTSLDWNYILIPLD